MFTVRPFAGLANRLRVIDSTVGIALQDSRKVRVVWNMNKECNCSFSELFYIPDFIELVEISTKRQDNNRLERLKRKVLKPLGIHPPFGYEKVMHDDDILLKREQGYDFADLLKYKSVFLNSTTKFYHHDKAFTYLKPIDTVEQKIQETTKYFGNSIVGLHIRRTDNLISIQKSPTYLFENKMQDEINKDEHVKFFLATDSKEEEQRLTSMFPNRVVTRQKELDRNSPNAIQDALVDLLLLSRTKKIYGSYWSSFSETSAEFGNIPFEQLKID